MRDAFNHRDIRKKLDEIRGDKLPEILSDFFRSSHGSYVGLSCFKDKLSVQGNEKCMEILGKVLCKQQLINKTLIALIMDICDIVEEDDSTE